MKVKSISFVLENCECITIDGKWIGNFLVDHIGYSISRLGCNCIDRMDEAGIFAIEIAAGADDEYAPFGRKDWNLTKFKRLMDFDDITLIDFTLYDEDDENFEQDYHFSLSWNEQSEEENINQHTYLSTLGNLYIVVAENKTIDDFFDREFINDAESMSVIFDMYDIPHKESENDGD